MSMDDSAYDSEGSRDIFACLRDSSMDPERRRLLREQAIQRHLPIVDRCASSLSLSVGQRDDVIQAGCEGLIHAVDRFDPTRGTPFVAYARPTITGEMLRYLRDCDSPIRLPRRHRDITHAARASREHLRRDLGREPRHADFARFLGVPLETVDAAFVAEDACSVLPLDPDLSPSQEQWAGEACLDHYLEFLPDRIDLEENLARLPSVERSIIRLYVCDGYSQTQIASRLGVSQVQVSRLFQRSIRQLRTLLDHERA